LHQVGISHYFTLGEISSTIFHENPSSHSPVVTTNKTDMAKLVK